MVRQMLLIGGTLLTALAILTPYSTAQDTSPTSKTLRTLYNFTGSDGSTPRASLVMGPGGVLYGTTGYGGTSNSGTVFALVPPSAPGGAWTETVLHNFAGGPDDGSTPTASVAIGGGVLYGTTELGGTSNYGTVFSLTPPASPGGVWAETVIHNFTGGDDGGYPESNVLIGPGGVLYVTTNSGGVMACPFGGCGTVFALRPPAAAGGSWKGTVIHTFTFGDGGQPSSAVVMDSNGVLYGTTPYGGTPGNGTVFSLTPPASPGGSWVEAVLYSFTGLNDGGQVLSAVALGNGGIIYGTTALGGVFGFGTAFSLTPPASPGGIWTETVLHSFGSSSRDGMIPSGVVIGSGGALYGTTQYGGSTCQGMGCGTVLALTPPSSPGGAWTENILHRFSLADGANPGSAVVIGRGGLLYGTTASGGTANSGTVFALEP